MSNNATVNTIAQMVVDHELVDELIPEIVDRYCKKGYKEARLIFEYSHKAAESAFSQLDRESDIKQYLLSMMINGDSLKDTFRNKTSKDYKRTRLAMMAPVCKHYFPDGACKTGYSGAEKAFFDEFESLLRDKDAYDDVADRSWAEMYDYDLYFKKVKGLEDPKP